MTLLHGKKIKQLSTKDMITRRRAGIAMQQKIAHSKVM
jgi:hypothetical protein